MVASIDFYGLYIVNEQTNKQTKKTNKYENIRVNKLSSRKSLHTDTQSLGFFSSNLLTSAIAVANKRMNGFFNPFNLKQTIKLASKQSGNANQWEGEKKDQTI